MFDSEAKLRSIFFFHIIICNLSFILSIVTNVCIIFTELFLPFWCYLNTKLIHFNVQADSLIKKII